MQDVDSNFHSEYGDLWRRAFSNARRALWWHTNWFYRHARSVVRYHLRAHGEFLHLAISEMIAASPWLVDEQECVDRVLDQMGADAGRVASILLGVDSP